MSYGTPLSEGDPPNYDWRKEREANRFAAELLMPADKVRADVGSYSLSRLTKRFDVSQPAMAYRLASLKLEANELPSLVALAVEHVTCVSPRA